MRSILGRSTPRGALGAALAAAAVTVASLAACSAGGDTADGAGTAGAAAGTSASPVATAPPSSVTVDTTEVATDAPAEATAGDAGEDAGEDAAGDTGAGGRPRSVEVTTTYAGVLAGGSSVEAGGYVGVVELDGTCTLTLTRDGTVRTATAEATPDATTTACGGLEVPLSDLGSGTWEAVLGYESDRSSGEAPAVEVEVP